MGAAVLLPESPRLVAKRRRAAAARALTTLRGGDDAARAEDLDALVRSTGGADDGLGVRVVLAALCGGGDAGVRRPLAIVLCVMLFQQFSGINAVIFYSGPLLASAGMANGDLGGVLVMTVQVLGTGLALVLMDRLGRRPLLAGSLCGMAAAAALLALHFLLEPPPFVALVALFLYIAAFSAGPRARAVAPDARAPADARARRRGRAGDGPELVLFVPGDGDFAGLVARIERPARSSASRSCARSAQRSWRPRCRRRRACGWTRSRRCFGRGPRSPRRVVRRACQARCVQYRAG